MDHAHLVGLGIADLELDVARELLQIGLQAWIRTVSGTWSPARSVSLAIPVIFDVPTRRRR
jgi:hypothetical protein